MSDEDLIRRGDARRILEEEGFLERSLANLNNLPAVQVGVKPLEWDRHPDADHDPSCNEHYGGGQNNFAGQNEYAIYPHPCAVGYFVLDVMGNRCDEDFPSIEAAKAAAQADYEARIRSALTAQPSPDVAALVELLTRSKEELRLIRMKDTGAVYDILLRTELDATLARLKGGAA